MAPGLPVPIAAALAPYPPALAPHLPALAPGTQHRLLLVPPAHTFCAEGDPAAGEGFGPDGGQD